jgi:hypothetical protein
MQSELNTSIGQMNTDIGGIAANVTAAQDAQTAAELAETNAEAAQAAAEAASNATLWVSGTSYSSGDVVYSPIDYKSYRANTATSGTTDPSLSADWTALSFELPAAGDAGNVLTSDGADWISAAGAAGSEVIRVPRTSNTILGVDERGNLIDITSGTFTQTFTAAATLGDGWYCYIRNSGSGDITLDPDSSETIDGVSSYIMYPGECRLVQCDGSTGFTSVILAPFFKTFTSSGNFEKPAGYSYFHCEIWGGGGGAGRSNQSTGGGGGGAHVSLLEAASSLSASESITVGAGGAGGVSSPSTGSAGGSTICFGITATGGFGSIGQNGLDREGVAGGSVSPYSTATVLSGYAHEGGKAGLHNTSTASNGAGYTNHGGGGGGGGAAGTTPYLPDGGGSIFGGGGGGGGRRSGGAVPGGTGGVSVLGGNGGDGGTDSVNGSDGSIPGGGGGGAGINRNGGSGGNGLVHIKGII